MRKSMMVMVVALFVATFNIGAQEAVFINEIHYDNDSTDTGEFVEIAGPAGTDLAGWTVVLYNGNGGAAYDTIPLSGVLPDQSLGGGTLAFFRAGIQNGSPDGMALVDSSSQVRQFLSYEGTFTAVGGPADGLTSIDIGVSEPGTTPVGSSVYLIDQPNRGSVYSDFIWVGPFGESPNAVNPGQVLPVELMSISVE